jgi:hypothetical protein
MAVSKTGKTSRSRTRVPLCADLSPEGIPCERPAGHSGSHARGRGATALERLSALTPSRPSPGRGAKAGRLRERVGGDTALDLLDDALGMLAMLSFECSQAGTRAADAYAERCGAISSVLSELRPIPPPPLTLHPCYRASSGRRDDIEE